MNLLKRILLIVFTIIIAFGLIISANYLTRSKVEANEEAKIQAAFDAVFPDAASFDEPNYRADYLQRYLTENGFPSDQVFVNQITFARDEFREVQGIVAYVSGYKKFGGIIRMLVGISNDGTVNGFRILSISDAKGLDFKVKDSEFEAQFEGVRTDRFLPVSYESSSPSEIVMENGAEDASQAVIRAVNAAILANTFIDEYYGGVIG